MDIELLTEDEHNAMDLISALAGILYNIMGNGPQRDHDWDEVSMHLHAMQRIIMAQAAARAYPNKYRLLGEDIATGGIQ